jgi:hypothetical protein
MASRLKIVTEPAATEIAPALARRRRAHWSTAADKI